MKRLILGGLLSLSVFAQATPMRVGPTLSTYRMGIATDALGSACFAFDVGADLLPCSPADIAFTRGNSGKAQVYLANNLRISNEALEILRRDQSTPEFLEEIFNERRSSELQAAIDLAWRREGWGLQLTPIRLFYHSSFRNEALTEARLLVFQEAAANLQWGRYLGDDWAMGLQTRLVNRKFVSQSFFLSDAYSESGRGLLDPQEQTLLYLEPGIQYHGLDYALKPRFGVTMTNLGVTNRASSFSQRPQFHVAASINPDIGESVLGLGIDAFLHEDLVEAKDAFTLGVAWSLPIFQVFGSVSTEASALGVNVPLGVFNLAASFRRESVDFGGIAKTTDSKAALALGVNF